MAVTQQLVRVPADVLAECLRSVAAVDRLCSLRATAPGDHLDLGWAPARLHRAWANAPDAALLRRALDGDDEVNPAYRDHPDTVFEHPVTALEPPSVAAVEAALRSAPATGCAGEAALCEFYAGAAGRGLAVVLWWD